MVTAMAILDVQCGLPLTFRAKMRTISFQRKKISGSIEKDAIQEVLG